MQGQELLTGLKGLLGGKTHKHDPIEPTIMVEEEDSSIKRVIDVFERHFFSQIPGNYWIAGGAVVTVMDDKWLDMDKQDVDLFFASEEDYNETAKFLIDAGAVEKGLSSGGNAMQYEWTPLLQGKGTKPKPWNIDLVRVHSDTVAECLNGFDLLISCIATNGSEVIMHQDWMQAWVDKKMRLHNPQNSVFRPEWKMQLLSRVIKYQRRGYECDKEFYESLSRVLINS